MVETEQERRRRMQQTRLFPGERTLGGALYTPPSPQRPEVATRRLNPPPPRVTEYGPHGSERPERVGVSQPAGTLPGAPAYTVRGIPADLTARWRPPFPLRESQLRAVAEFHRKHKGTVLYPTGVGKSDLAIAAINDLRVPTVVIVPTLVLVDQWRTKLRAWNIEAGSWTGAEKSPNYVTVSTYQSLYGDPTLIRRFPFLVLDEAHRASAEEFRQLLYEIPNHPYALALTATRPSDEDRQRLLLRYLPPLAEMSPAEAIGAGHLSKVRVVPEPVSFTYQEQDDYTKLSKTLIGASRRLGTSNPSVIAKLVNDMVRGEAARAFLKALSARRLLLSNVLAKRDALVRIVRRHPRERVLLFSESVPALVESCRALRMAGIGCHVISGATEAADRRFILDNWGRQFWVLGSVKVLELGFDVPEVGVAIFLASGTGKLQLTQRLGRILRPLPGKEAEAVAVYVADTVEARVARTLQRLAGQPVTVNLPEGMEEYEDG